MLRWTGRLDRLLDRVAVAFMLGIVIAAFVLLVKTDPGLHLIRYFGAP